MSETELNLLTVDSERVGEEVVVRSTNSFVTPSEIPGYVAEDGTVRQQSNGAAFNADAYEIVE